MLDLISVFLSLFVTKCTCVFVSVEEKKRISRVCFFLVFFAEIIEKKY